MSWWCRLTFIKCSTVRSGVLDQGLRSRAAGADGWQRHQGVIGNAGRGVKSGVTMGNRHVKVLGGAPNVFAEKRRLARHLDAVEMNGEE